MCRFCSPHRQQVTLFMTLSYYPEFLTATILKWQCLFASDDLKKIVLGSLQWLIKQKKCKVFAFVIMPNHIHIMWQIGSGYQRQEVQGALFSYTAHEFMKYLEKRDPLSLKKYYVNDADRKYQFWERNPLFKECRKDKFFMQKINYIHNNPCQSKWNLSLVPADYYWSSASFYESGDGKFLWLSHYMER